VKQEKKKSNIVHHNFKIFTYLRISYHMKNNYKSLVNLWNSNTHSKEYLCIHRKILYLYLCATVKP